MKTMLAAAAAVGLFAAGPALADPGNGHGKKSHSQMSKKDHQRYVAQQRTYSQWDDRRAAYQGDGRGYWDGSRYYRDGRYYGGNCPPGLAKKNNGCLPPGQAKSRYSVGQRLPNAYWDDYIPSQYRDRYNDGTYRYNDGYVYRVNPQTYVIEEIIRAILG